MHDLDDEPSRPSSKGSLLVNGPGKGPGKWVYTDIIKGKRIENVKDKLQVAVAANIGLLKNQPEIDEAINYVEWALRDTELQVTGRMMTRVFYFLNNFYYHEYLARIALEFVLRVLDWPYVEHKKLKNLIGQVDCSMVADCVPKLLACHNNVNILIEWVDTSVS